MELGANRKSLTQLGVLLALLALVTYFQFFREPESPARPAQATQAPAPGASQGTSGQQATTAQPRGRFQPRVGRSGREVALDPLTADATIRKDRLQRLREIEEPAVERDIFNFGRPKPVRVQGPTQEEMLQAQQRLEQTRRAPPPPPSKPAQPPPPPPAKPPPWKYYGVASLPGSDSRRAFLLDGEEILVVAQGAMVRDRYRIGTIGEEGIQIEDIQAAQEFSIPLQVPK